MGWLLHLSARKFYFQSSELVTLPAPIPIGLPFCKSDKGFSAAAFTEEFTFTSSGCCFSDWIGVGDLLPVSNDDGTAMSERLLGGIAILALPFISSNRLFFFIIFSLSASSFDVGFGTGVGCFVSDPMFCSSFFFIIFSLRASSFDVGFGTGVNCFVSDPIFLSSFLTTGSAIVVAFSLSSLLMKDFLMCLQFLMGQRQPWCLEWT
jgi:hypothetical protein